MTQSVILYFNTIMRKSIQQGSSLSGLTQTGIQVLDHPPCSPDINPIEHVWVELKKRLHHLHPDIATTPGGPKKGKERLAQVLPEVWETIPPEFCESLWRSIPDRVQAVLDAKGWYTRY